MNDQNELKLSMTPEEVRAILGEPDDVKEDSWGAFAFYYAEEEENIKIRFVDNQVVHITRCSKDINIEDIED